MEKSLTDCEKACKLDIITRCDPEATTMDDITKTNKEYFNKLASEYDSRYNKTLGILEDRIRSRAGFIGLKQGGRLLDYACGTGLLSRTLSSQLSGCVGVDVSENMVEAYNAKGAAQGLSPEQWSAHVGNLILPSASEDLSSPSFYGFDGAGVGLGFHHFDDCDLAARRLVERLSPGGVLFIMDFLPHHVPSQGSAGVPHHGFSEETVRAIFEQAGADKHFAFQEFEEEITFSKPDGTDMKRKVFIARGEKL